MDGVQQEGVVVSPHEFAVNNVVRTPSNVIAIVVAVDPDIVECVQADDFTAPHGIFFRSELTWLAENTQAWAAEFSHFPGAIERARLASGPAAEAPSDEQAADALGRASLDFLIGFLAWLSTREEIVGPFSRIHHPDPRLAPRLAAEYLAAQA